MYTFWPVLAWRQPLPNPSKELLTRAAMWQSSGGAYNDDAAMAAKNSELSAKARELIGSNAALRQAASRLSDLVEQYQDRYFSPD